MVSLKILVSASFSLVSCSLASGYTLKHKYDASNWFDSFKYHNEDDPTHGTVDYVNLADAQRLGLTKIVDNKVYMGVDTQSVVPSSSRGRKSIWVTSKEEFEHGLLIGDFQHVPSNDCGVWPGFWTIREGEGLPYGEIDILEYFNDVPHGYMTLHSDPKLPECKFNQSPSGQRGAINQGFTSCSAGPGCSTIGPDNGAGTEFNKGQGGVYAMDWTSQHIKIWYFARNKVPADITAGKPDPSKWGMPNANFDSADGGCDIGKNFPPQTIYFDTTFCGNSAGGKGWTDWTDCSKRTGVATCEEFVRKNPQAFQNAYWLVNSVKIYQ